MHRIITVYHNLCANDKQIHGWAETVHVPLILHTSPNDAIKWYSIHRCFGSRWCVPTCHVPLYAAFGLTKQQEFLQYIYCSHFGASSSYDSVKVLPRKFVGASKSWSDWPLSEEAPMDMIWSRNVCCLLASQMPGLSYIIGLPRPYNDHITPS